MRPEIVQIQATTIKLTYLPSYTCVLYLARVSPEQSELCLVLSKTKRDCGKKQMPFEMQSRNVGGKTVAKELESRSVFPGGVGG